MAESNFRGPVVSIGALEDNTVSLFDGPSLSYQGYAVPDPRTNPYQKDGLSPARVPSFLVSAMFVVTDNIPSILSTTTIATALQSAVTAQALTLNTTSVGGSAAGVPSWTFGIPIIPIGTTVATAVGAIDFGFTTGTTAAASTTVVVVDSTMFKVGQWLVIGGAGNTGNTTSIITQVQSITNATTIKIAPAAVGALSHAPIGNANLQSNLAPPAANFGPAAASANAAMPYQAGGLATFFNPLEGITRNLTVTGNTTNATAAWIVAGYDIYGAAMTELITASGTSTVGGKKAFKYLLSVTCNATSVTGTYTFGLGDVYGCNVRADRFETLTVSWNGKPLSSNAGFTAAFSSVLSNNTSGDVRGTLAVSSFTAFNAATSNATGRLFIGIDLPLMNLLNAAAGSTSATSMFGVAQA
jgi:hypothetical protein